MKCFIINLPEQQARRRRIADNFHGSGLEYEFFPAINGDDGPSYFSKVRKTLCLVETTRNPVANEIGCYASHLLLWKKCLELDQPIVVLEDDVSLAGHMGPAFSARLHKLTAKYGFLRLEPSEDNMDLLRARDLLPDELVEHSDRYGVLTQYHPQLRTSAYSIAPRVASAFIAKSSVFSCPVDHFLRRVWVHRQPLFALKPAPFFLDQSATVSNIDGRNKPESLLYRRYIRILRNLYRIWARHKTQQMHSETRIIVRNIFSDRSNTSVNG